jgi:GntR family transcriptional regulator
MATVDVTPPEARPLPAAGAARVRPKYDRLKDAVLATIESAAPGTPLPPERELCAQYGVSRTTVRQSLQELELEGYIIRHQGRGTFVARRKVSLALQMVSFTEDMRRRGLRPSSQLLRAEEVEPSGEVAGYLGLPPSGKALRLERLRLADEEPMALAVTYLPAQRVKRLAALLHDEASLYAILAQNYGIVPTEAQESFESVLASPENAELLGTQPGSALTLLTRRSWDGDGVPVEFARSYYRGDRYRFVTHLQRPDAHG